MPVSNTLIVHLQALGGKFLGPNAYEHQNIVVYLLYSGGLVSIPYIVGPDTDDGTISTAFTPDSSSFMPILTPSGTPSEPAVNYLTPGDKTIVGKVSILPVKMKETATLVALIPTPLGRPLYFLQSVLLDPLQAIFPVTIVVPGLLLTPSPILFIDKIALKVTMMCGCEIKDPNPKDKPYWLPEDFRVNARVFFEDNTPAVNLPMTFDTGTNSSIFTAPLPATSSPIRSIQYEATQISTKNYGFYYTE